MKGVHPGTHVWFRHPAGGSLEQGTVLDRAYERGEWWVMPLPYGTSKAITLKGTAMFATKRGAQTGADT